MPDRPPGFPALATTALVLQAGIALACLHRAHADERIPPPATAPATVTVTRDGSVQHVRARLRAAALAATCYAVLADFDRLEDFVPGLESSEVVSAPGVEPLLLRQVGVASALFFRSTVDVTLAVRVQPPVRIEFERVAGNLRRMRGHWAVAGDARHCVIDYEAEIEPAFWVPPLVGPRLMRRQVERQLAGVLGEIDTSAVAEPSP